MATTYDVVLEKVGNQQLKTTKALCSALGLGLAAAKGMVDKAPTTVAKGLDKDKALALFKELEALGNTVSIPGMEMKTEAPATKKTTTTKKQTTKKSAPSSSKAAPPKNDDFDAIFGGDNGNPFDRRSEKTVCLDCGRTINSNIGFEDLLKKVDESDKMKEGD